VNATSGGRGDGGESTTESVGRREYGPLWQQQYLVHANDGKGTRRSGKVPVRLAACVDLALDQA
jgi:hypothetical protein